MIVAGRFAGDDADNVMRAQHDVYGAALAIIHDAVLRRWRDAQAILACEAEGFAGLARDSFDHRVAQDAHDLMAAIWRAQRRIYDPQLPFDGKSPSSLMEDWLNWLRAFMADCDATLARHLGRAIAFENTPAGYEAEDAATAFLKGRLADETA